MAIDNGEHAKQSIGVTNDVDAPDSGATHSRTDSVEKDSDVGVGGEAVAGEDERTDEKKDQRGTAVDEDDRSSSDS